MIRHYSLVSQGLKLNHTKIMEKVNTFLESSTIHGLVYISTAKRLQKLFWILVVLSGFICAGVLINEAFQSWAESPVSTNIETLPIAKLKLPKISVCPPKNTFTDLNYDLMVVENRTIDNDTRKDLVNYAKSLLIDEQYQELYENVSKTREENRFYNWYHGFTKIELPVYASNYYRDYLYYSFNTSATSGSISTRYFGHQYEYSKLDHKFRKKIQINVPSSIKGDESGNFTLHINFTKIQIPGVIDKYYYKSALIPPKENLIFWRTKNPGSLEMSKEVISIQLFRSVSLEDLKGFVET